MNKYVLNPTDFIHQVLKDAPDGPEFRAEYDTVETELFNLGLYPAGYNVYIDADTIVENPNMSEKLANTIRDILSENKLDGFYLDERE